MKQTRAPQTEKPAAKPTPRPPVTTESEGEATPEEAPDRVRRAIHAPTADSLTPSVLNSLQNSHGNRFVSHLVSRVPMRRKPIQRGIVDSPAVYKTDDQIRALTLDEFQQYAGEQIDWAKEKTISDVVRGYFFGLLQVARWPNILSGCGTMKVKSLIDFGLIKLDGTIDDALFDPLKTYSQAVSGTVQSVEIKAPTNIPRKAAQWGRALDKLLSAPSVNATQIRIIMPQAEFEALLANNWLDDFANYIQRCTPRLEAPGGIEVRSYMALRAEGKDPVSYLGTSIDGQIRNFHRFQRAALDKLVANFNVNQPDAGKRKPLTLILHSALDHNGAFHRDSALTAVVTDTRLLTLMIEGKETLAEVQNDLAPLATQYGKDNKIDQVMIAGHGNAQTIQLGGQNAFTQTTAIKDQIGLGSGFLDFHKDDVITVMEVPQTGYGKGSFDGKEGYFRLSATTLRGNPTATNEGINLKDTSVESDALFDEMLKNMANDPTVAPHRRIVFNACLTNSNAVSDPLDKDSKVAAQEVRDHIDANSSLTFYLQKKASKEGLNNIHVLGANGSIGVVTLIDKKTGGLDIISSPDPKVTAPKIVYVEEGQEPQGVLRAVLECWAGVGASTETDQKKAQADCFAAMDRRVKKSATTWAQTIIKSIFQIILAKYRTDAETIRLFGDAAGNLNELSNEAECRVSKLLEANLGPTGHLKDDAQTIFTALTSNPTWTSRPSISLVVNQVWMMHQDAKSAAVLASLVPFNCQTADQFLDVDALKPHLDKLLALTKTPSHSQLLLAFRVIDTDSSVAAAKDFLLNVADKGLKRFPSGLKVGTILQGKPSEQVILEKIGLGSGSGPSVGTDTKANFDLDGDGTNETYIEPLPGMRGVTLYAEDNILYQKPDTSSSQIGKPLGKSGSVVVLGQIGDFYAVDQPGSANRVAFIKQDRILPL